MILDANFGTLYVHGEGVAEGIELGKQKTYDEFWDVYQDNGNRRSYQFGFSSFGWTDTTFRPKYDIIAGEGYSGTQMFWNSRMTNLAEALERQGVTLDTSLCGHMQQMFQLSVTSRIPEINCSNAMIYGVGLQYTFLDAQVETIDKLVVTEDLTYTNAFGNCANLKNITFDGVIGQSIDFQWSTKLSKASIINIFEHLSNTASGKAITLSHNAVYNAFMGEDGEISEEFGELVYTKPNWEVSLV